MESYGNFYSRANMILADMGCFWRMESRIFDIVIAFLHFFFCFMVVLSHCFTVLFYFVPWYLLILILIYIWHLMNQQKNVDRDVEAKGFNPGLIVLLLVGGLLLLFLVGNYVLYIYAQKTLPPKKKKPVSKKKLKKERLKQGVSAPGE
ncbi:DNA-binding protein S1FA1-like [Olea europaea var. sylvestris]|uniref:DNA-binding protein S1FA1-like n=1 Tax=Olea europaea var. sylvestris TaxID=158386 RepID=UPI000C1D0D6B|nr:DNA-binding protein S1FA1-like [Olea europaea var. sylvestris]